MENLISVIVPVYNAEKYLNKCVDSILNQTYESLEVILVDDGSTDNSGKICDEYAQKDCRTKVIHKQNGGVCLARKVGVENATAEYVCFIDSDDYVGKEYISKFVNVPNFEKYDMIYSNRYIGENCEQLIESSFGKTFYGEKIIDEEYLENILCFNRKVEMNYGNAPWNKMYKTDKLKIAINQVDSRIFKGEDMLMNLAYLLISKNIYSLQKREDMSCSYFYRNTPNSIMNTYNIEKHIDGTKYFNENLIKIFSETSICNIQTQINTNVVNDVLWNIKKIFEHYSKNKDIKKSVKEFLKLPFLKIALKDFYKDYFINKFDKLLIFAIKKKSPTLCLMAKHILALYLKIKY